MSLLGMIKTGSRTLGHSRSLVRNYVDRTGPAFTQEEVCGRLDQSRTRENNVARIHAPAALHLK
ncbi:hypothetical protein E4U35_007926 [Claviceps purpurea]|nr:hypothetical protein E4U12_004173 [Claviceps purpurea]KAG6159839.1 hypothetical protein E4U37_002347 [Claviceps purpurea]KAG6175969.1 hypothetical protein E4U36_008349 [Claviceps purpurea]KAG6208872.1 hypothetical protein E4U35_007926 [Claviceps purpurea]KAG6306552.1 hypothetical protein E4U45_006887 [Claviceps purpurea]